MPCAARPSRAPRPHLYRPCNVSDISGVHASERSRSQPYSCSQPISDGRSPLLLGPGRRLNRAIWEKVRTISQQSSSAFQDLNCSASSPAQISNLTSVSYASALILDDQKRLELPQYIRNRSFCDSACGSSRSYSKLSEAEVSIAKGPRIRSHTIDCGKCSRRHS
jgi:hypothetical protein